MKQRKQQNITVGSTHIKGSVGGQSWYRGENCNFFPEDNDFKSLDDDYSNLRAFIKEFVFKGWEPQKALFNDKSRLLALGSCFARELQYALKDEGKVLDHLWMPEGLNNTFALRQFISWVCRGETDSQAFWYDNDKYKKSYKWTPPEEQNKYKELFQKASGFVLTIGLAEVWRDKTENKVFWRGVPDDIFDERRHELVVSTVDENTANLRNIVSSISKISHAPIIFTLSPVPLRATFRDRSCITADCISKSILRVALDNLMKQDEKDVYYWPSFEIVRWLSGHLSIAAFSDAKDRDCRHVNTAVVSNIISSFVEFYFE